MKKTILLYFCIALSLSAIAVFPTYGEDNPLAKWRQFSKTKDAQKMSSWMRCSMKETLTGEKCRKTPDFTTPPFYGQLGLFVTLVKGGKVRGCFGAFDHRTDDIAMLLKEYLMGAMRRDHRYPPLTLAESGAVQIIVTIAGSQYPVDDLENIDPSRYGILVIFDNNERVVFVPSEIKSIHYLKNNLQGREINQIQAFRAITIK